MYLLISFTPIFFHFKQISNIFKKEAQKKIGNIKRNNILVIN